MIVQDPKEKVPGPDADAENAKQVTRMLRLLKTHLNMELDEAEDPTEGEWATVSAAAEEDAETADGRIMKINRIAIATDKDDPEGNVAENFGRTEYFFVCDFKTGRKEMVKNPYSQVFGGAGIQSAQFMIENDIDLVAVKNVGTNAYVILETAEITVFNPKEEKIPDVLNSIEHQVRQNEIQLKTIGEQ